MWTNPNLFVNKKPNVEKLRLNDPRRRSAVIILEIALYQYLKAAGEAEECFEGCRRMRGTARDVECRFCREISVGVESA